MKTFRAFLLGVATTLAFTGALAVAQGRRPAEDTVVAEVNGERITYGQLLDRLLDYNGQAALEAMVNRLIIKQAADRERVTVTDADIDRRLADAKKALGAGGDDVRAQQRYQQWLYATGLTPRQHREQLRYALLQEKIALKTRPVSDAELERLSVRIIAVDNEQKARQIIQKLRNRTPFEFLAKTESDHPNGKQNDGLLPPIHRLQMPKLWAHASKLNPGEYTREPVPATDGFLILKLEGRLPASTLKPQERQALVNVLQAQHVDAWFANARKTARINYPKPLRELVGLPPE